MFILRSYSFVGSIALVFASGVGAPIRCLQRGSAWSLYGHVPEQELKSAPTLKRMSAVPSGSTFYVKGLSSDLSFATQSLLIFRTPDVDALAGELFI